MLPSSARARRALVLAMSVAATGGLASTAHSANVARPAAALAPSDDAFTTSRNLGHNYGALTRLVLARKPVSRAFLRFTLGGFPGPRFHAVLYVYSFSNSKKGLRLRHASDTGWDERGLTGAKLPGTGPRSVHSGPLRRDHWKGIDVTHLVNSSGVVSLALAPRGNTRVTLASREAGNLAPRLALSYGTRPSITSVPALAGAASSSASTPRPSAGPAPAGSTSTTV